MPTKRTKTVQAKKPTKVVKTNPDSVAPEVDIDPRTAVTIRELTKTDLMREFNALYMQVEATSQALGAMKDSTAGTASNLADEALMLYTIAKGDLFNFVHKFLLDDATAGLVVNNDRPYGCLSMRGRNS